MEIENRTTEPARFYMLEGERARFLGVVYPGEGSALRLPSGMGGMGGLDIQLVAVPLGSSVGTNAQRTHSPDAVWSQPERAEHMASFSFALVGSQLITVPRSGL